MPLSESSLKSKIIAELGTAGFDVSNEFSFIPQFAEAVAKAVVDEITSNAVAVDPGGISPGNWPIE